MATHVTAPSFKRSFLKDYLTSRWMTMAASFFIMACNGTVYSFGIYSQTMKLTLRYNQQQVTTIGFYKDLGANLGIVAGLLQDFAGPWLVILLGAILNVVGSLLIWLSITERIAHPAVWQMCLYHFICFNATSFVNTGVIVTEVKNFPGNKGFVLGLLKGFIGLSGAILAQIYHAIYGNNPSSFVMLVMWLPSIVFISFMFLIRPRPVRKDGNETHRFFVFLGTSIFLAAFLFPVILVQKLSAVTRMENKILAAIAVFILLIPLVVVLWFVFKDRKTESRAAQTNILAIDYDKDCESKHTTREPHHAAKESPSNSRKIYSLPSRSLQAPSSNNDAATLALQPDEIALAKGFFGGCGEKVRRGGSHTVLQALLKLDFWLLFVTSTCALGTGLMAIDNIGQYASSLGYSSQKTSAFVSLISIWNFVGRVSSGFISEFCLRKYATPRPLFFALPLAVACIGHLIFAFAVPGAVNVGSVIVGLCYGFQTPMLFTILSELFGLAFFGTLYNLATMSLPLGTELMSVLVGGKLYDREAEKQYRPKMSAYNSSVHGHNNNNHIAPTPAMGFSGAHAQASGQLRIGKPLVCYGKRCYENSFLIMAGVSAFGSILGIILTVRTRKFYKENVNRLTNGAREDDQYQSQDTMHH